mmetsp:Transcript_94326/g.215805  ORF Transcript_94326/g.215805 Transcript_94326/m.215805 type:complete len:212 (-) Transcript_94326:271-906(-)
MTQPQHQQSQERNPRGPSKISSQHGSILEKNSSCAGALPKGPSRTHSWAARRSASGRTFLALVASSSPYSPPLASRPGLEPGPLHGPPPGPSAHPGLQATAPRQHAGPNSRLLPGRSGLHSLPSRGSSLRSEARQFSSPLRPTLPFSSLASPAPSGGTTKAPFRRFGTSSPSTISWCPLVRRQKLATCSSDFPRCPLRKETCTSRSPFPAP